MELFRALDVYLAYKEAAKEGLYDNYDVDLLQDFIEEVFQMETSVFEREIALHTMKLN